MSKRDISPPRTRSRRRQRFGSLTDDDNIMITKTPGVSDVVDSEISPLQPRRLDDRDPEKQQQQHSPNTEKRLKESERRMLVSVRCRPLSNREKASGNLEVVRPFVESQTVVISKRGKSGGVLRSERGADHEYCFDQVFGALSSNEQVYAAAASHLVVDVLKGINCTIFAYGATGAGKTHTMLGSDGGAGNEDSDPGVIARAMVDVFAGIETARQRQADGIEEEHGGHDEEKKPNEALESATKKNSKSAHGGKKHKHRRRSGVEEGDILVNAEWKVSVSFLEVYNETIYDLLTTEKQKALIPCEDPSDQSVNVLGLTQSEVSCTKDVLALLSQGNSRRKMEPTAANQVSSRSHAVLQVTVDFIRELRAPGRRLLKVVKRSSRLSMIDLAGSERAAANSNAGARLREGANINKSLLALANCINALSSKGKKGAATRVKYRDSKLTHLLKSSLEGKCRVSMIANINPSNHTYEESHNTLKYANRAKAIKVSASNKGNRVTRMDSPNDERIAELCAENQELRQQLVHTLRKTKRRHRHGDDDDSDDGSQSGETENLPYRMNVGPPLPPLQLYQDDARGGATPLRENSERRVEDGDEIMGMCTPFFPRSCGASTATTTASGRRKRKVHDIVKNAHSSGTSSKLSTHAAAAKRQANDTNSQTSPPPEYASNRVVGGRKNSDRSIKAQRVSPSVATETLKLKQRIAQLEGQANRDLRAFVKEREELKSHISQLSKENARLVKQVKATTTSNIKSKTKRLPTAPVSTAPSSPHQKARNELRHDRMQHHMKQALKAMQRCSSCRQWSLEMAGALRMAEEKTAVNEDVSNGVGDVGRGLLGSCVGGVQPHRLQLQQPKTQTHAKQDTRGVAAPSTALTTAGGITTRGGSRRVSGIPRLHLPKLADFLSDSDEGDGGESSTVTDSVKRSGKTYAKERRKSGIPMPSTSRGAIGVSQRTRQARRLSSQFPVHYAEASSSSHIPDTSQSGDAAGNGSIVDSSQHRSRRQSMAGRIPTSGHTTQQDNMLQRQQHPSCVDSPMSLIGEEGDEYDDDL